MKKGRRLVVANWKMNPLSLESAKEIFRKTKNISKKLKRTTTIVCPPSVYLEPLARLNKNEVKMGAQNVHHDRQGSYTGEVSAAMVEDLGAQYVILGHSERRAMGETDEAVARKISTALSHNLTPILCIGEGVRDIEGNYLEFLKEEIKNSLRGISKRELQHLIIAYEPIWAIGKSDTDAMDGKEVYETSLYIRKILAGMYGKDYAFAVPILYGGSVTFRNAFDIVKEGRVAGLLVGRQSLEMKGFGEVLNIVDSI